MSNSFEEKELDRIFIETDGDGARKAAMATAWLCAHFKTVNIKVFDVQSSSSLSDYYVVASAENTTQAKSLVDELIPHFKKQDFYPISLEGMQDAEWILLDLGDIILHVFQETSREVYALDQLWAEYPLIDIPQSYFTGSGEQVEKQIEAQEDEKNYF